MKLGICNLRHNFLTNTTHAYCRLKQKIACKTNDEHALVKAMPPPNETIAKITARSVSGKPGKKHDWSC